jgi:hypothetical protein
MAAAWPAQGECGECGRRGWILSGLIYPGERSLPTLLVMLSGEMRVRGISSPVETKGDRVRSLVVGVLPSIIKRES